MKDEDIIKLAESKGFGFIKHKDSWFWTVKAPDDDFFTSEFKGKRMDWLKIKLWNYM